LVDDVLGKPLNFGLGRSLEENAGVIATNGHIHAKVIEVVKAVLERKHAEQETNGSEVKGEDHSEPAAVTAVVAEFVAEPEAQVSSKGSASQVNVPVQEEDLGGEEGGHGHSHEHGHSHGHGQGHSHGH